MLGIFVDSYQGRQRTPTSKLHRHCESCYSRRCKAPVEISVSCVVISCRTLCGATFHLCKEEEHALLCPNEMVPCLNAHYGCPFTMCRSRLAQHLEVCPASVVSCSMEWNRWPVEEMHLAFYENVLNETYAEEPLDMSMALRDQRHLFQSLKMKTLFPELTEKAEEEEEPPVQKGAVGGSPEAVGGVCGAVGGATADPAHKDGALELTFEEDELTEEQRQALIRGSGVNTSNYNVWERMFSMELSGCRETVKSLGNNPTPSKKRHEQDNGLETLEEEEPEMSMNNVSAENISEAQYIENMSNMDEEKFLVASFMYTCQTNPTKKRLYAGRKPKEIKTVKPFVIPSSFKARSSRIRNPSILRKFSVSVDTSDLGVDMDDMPNWDEVQATLLCSLENEHRGHLIAESSSFDALFVNIGTQTYDFLSAPFQQNDSLADITAGRDPKIHVQIEAESVTGKHNKCSSAFTFLCSQVFRRNEYAPHFRNVHADIQCHVSGWFEQRCPLAYLGCTFIQRRLRPASQAATVSYNKDLSTFTLKPEVSGMLYEGVKTTTSERARARNLDSLSRLPFEVLVHIARYLDSFSLSQLALVSKYMREVSGTLLYDRGIVSLKWEKKTYSHGGFCWKSKKTVWQFSNSFSTVDGWCFVSCPPMSEHLKVCPYYVAEHKSDPVPLIGIFDAEEEIDRTQNLVSMFSRKK
ncbi:F-box protein 40.1 isoform X1 [Alosa sapidissima]|uniref:F-box protein 40.1 isoform X1 n=1 Tax=Alosa sapidissima TaxID=34773 RepID=UPI001C098906|nr:F-box protein 40.1 isoform X1 [Alosa sapidissima]